MAHDAPRPFALKLALVLIRIPGVFQLIFGLLLTPLGWFSGWHVLIPALLLVCSGIALIEAGIRIDSKTNPGRRWGIFAALVSGTSFLAICAIILFVGDTIESLIAVIIYSCRGVPALVAVACLVRSECVAWAKNVS